MIAVCLSAVLSLSSVSVELTKADESLRPAFERYAVEAEKKIVAFFAFAFKKPVVVSVAPNRKAFDKALFDRWKMEPTQSWMVGAAGADVLFVLSPRVWKTEAEEHDPNDAAEIAELVGHELVHSFHSQANSSREMEGLDTMAWLIEGLATYVSGQLARSHLGVAEREVRGGRAPESLAKAWSGRGRYGVAGSMVQFVDARYGRKKVVELLRVTSNVGAMRALGSNETQFLKDWQAWLRR